MSQQEYFGINSIIFLGSIIKQLNAKNVFLVTGKNSYESSGAKKAIEDQLKSNGCNNYRFSNFSVSPKLEEIKSGYNEFKKDKYDLIIAVGGGSAIDSAKAIKLFNYEEILNNTPLIAIPTTTIVNDDNVAAIIVVNSTTKI